MRWIVALLLLLGAHFALTALIPGPKALIYWPFGAGTEPTLPLSPGLARTATQLLAVVGGLGFLLALLALFHIAVPAEWFAALVVTGAAASALLYMLYLGLYAIAPLAISALLVYGVLRLGWTVPMLSA